MKPIWLETDLEPDDLLAIFFLIKRGFYPQFIVVGEGQAQIKSARMIRYLQLLKIDGLLPQDCSCQVIEGINSNHQFRADGHEFDQLELTQTTESVSYQTHYVNCFQSYIKSTLEPIYVGLKPPRELILYKSELDHELSMIKGYFYGSFNFRSLNNNNDLQILFSKMASVYLYESYYATGTENSMNQKLCPQIWSNLKQHQSTYIKTLMIAINLWNTHIKNDCEKRCHKLLKKLHLPPIDLYNSHDCQEILDYLQHTDYQTQFQRSLQIISNITNNLDSQMVLADQCLGLAVENPIFNPYLQPMEINFDNQNYTQLISSESHQTLVYQSVDTKIYDVIGSELLS